MFNMKKLQKIGLTLIFLLLLFWLIFIFVYPMIRSGQIMEQNLRQSLVPPSQDYLLGTDRFGRDLLMRSIDGGRVTIISTLIILIGSSSIGLIFGLITGYFDNIFSKVIQFVTDMFLSVPMLILAIAIASFLRGMTGIILALVIAMWPKYTRFVAQQTLSLKELPFIRLGKMYGMNDFQILIFHILPNLFSSFLSVVVIDASMVMVSIASLSFLGLGANNSFNEWGAMINEGRHYFQTAPWTIFAPCLLLFITVALLNLFADELRTNLN